MTWLDSENDSTANFDLLPKNNYRIMIESVSVIQTKRKVAGTDKKGEMIVVMFDILSDQFAGRKIFERFNVNNDNEKAEQIGRSQFSRLCKSVNVSVVMEEPRTSEGLVIEDFTIRKNYFEPLLTAQLRDKVCMASIDSKHDDFRGATVNFIRGFLSSDAPAMSASAPKMPSGEGIPF